MSWHPNDLVSDADLVAYERNILAQFNQNDWKPRRQKALEDWLFPLLSGRGFDPQRLRTRFVPTKVWSYTSSAYVDRTSAAQTDDGLNLATILAASTDYLYVGSDRPFRGLSVRMLEAVNSTVDSVLSVRVWTDRWFNPNDLKNATAASGKAFNIGGALTWSLPEEAVERAINGSTAYWARLSCSASPTAAKCGPLLVLRRSRLCAPVTFRTLALIFREAPTGQDGPWQEKADWYEQEADRAWQRVADQIGGEFDSNEDDAIDSDEAEQTAAQVSGGGWQLERM